MSLILILILFLDAAVIWNIKYYDNSKRLTKVFYYLIVIFIPVVGVSVYYLLRAFQNHKTN